MKKRILAIFLALVMVVGLLPTVAFANEAAACTYQQKDLVPTDGESYQLTLGGKDKGRFKPEAADGGWKIMKTSAPGTVGMVENPYLAETNGKLTYTDKDNATVWTYRNGAFSVTEKTTQKNSVCCLNLVYLSKTFISM